MNDFYVKLQGLLDQAVEQIAPPDWLKENEYAGATAEKRAENAAYPLYHLFDQALTHPIVLSLMQRHPGPDYPQRKMRYLP